MSNERQETVSDIVSEMRHDCPARHMDGTMYRDVDWVYTKGTVKRLADRIEAAYSRLPILTPEQWTQIAQQAAEMSDLKRENERLRVALIPVREVDCQLDNYPTKEAYMAALEIVVSNAQRIYNEGDEHI